MNTLIGKLRSRKNILIGQVEQVILLAIMHRKNHAYGIEIKDEIENRTGIKLTVGALYSTLDRMVKKDLIDCIDSEESKESSNTRGRRYFCVTSKGTQLLYEAIEISEKMRFGIDVLSAPGIA